MPRVALFATCLVDLFRPPVGFAAIHLLERAGCSVEVPLRQTCCGQPAFNSGDRKTAVRLARQTIETFESFDYVVLPSGSCAGMIIRHYPEILADDPGWRDRAGQLAGRTHELLSFLDDVLHADVRSPALQRTVTYHDSCHALRELGIQAQPRALLETVPGLEIIEMSDRESCCGFGGTFCVKYPEISTRMAAEKVKNILDTSADLVLGGDLACLMNIAGWLRRNRSSLEVRHIAEVLAGMTEEPAIGEGNE